MQTSQTSQIPQIPQTSQNQSTPPNPQTSKWLAIRASAGSGKTFALTLRYIYLLFLGARANEILCITFTNKAKDEMLSRITRTLFTLFQNPSDAYAQNLLDLGISEQAIKAQSKAIYTHFVESKNHIMTFDAFFNMVVKKFSFYAGVMSDYEVGADFKLNDEIFRKTLNSLSAREFGALVDFCAQNELRQKDILYMLSALNIHPHSAPFAESSKLEIASAFDDYRALVLHALEGQKGAHYAKARFSKEIDTNNICEMIKNVFTLTENMQRALDSAPDSASIAQKSQNLKDLFSQYFKQRENNALRQISSIYQKFKAHKLEVISRHNKLTFNDISEICYELLHSHIDKNFFYFRLDSKINHILVDEFQDTNLRQFENLQPLISEIKSGQGTKENKTLFFVGDEKQAIYGFRGGESRLFRAISDELQMSEHTLKDNYRSAKNIINFVNETFKNHFENYEAQNPKSDASGLVEIISANAENKQDCAFNIIKQRIETLLGNHKKNIAILTRSVSSAEEIYAFLRANFPQNKITLDAENSNNNELLIILNAMKFLQTNNIFYLKNCVKLNGGALDSAPEIAVKKDAQVHKIVHYIIEKFALYNSAALQILEESAKFDKLDEFVAHLQGTEIKSALEVDGEIQIMTIHKSKGLEFEDVIVCELRAKNRIDRRKFYAPDVRGEQIYYMKDAKERALVDSEFESVLALREAQNKNDALNVLYVAFTRPKDSLFIINMGENNALQLDLLALQDMKIGADILGEKSSQVAQSSAQIPAQYSFGKQSDFINKDEKRYSTLPQVRGIALHLALEMRLAYKNSDDEIAKILRGRFGLVLDEGERAQILRNMWKILQNPKLRKILEVAKRVRCEVAYLENNRLRRIDCLIEVGGGAVILDYKSSDLNLEEKKAQILQYADFARKHYKTVRAYLCFANGEILEAC